MKVGFVGAGAAAGSLAPACRAAGHAVVAVAAAHAESAAALAAANPGCRAVAAAQDVADASDLVFVAVPDDRIGPLAASMSWRAGQMAVHCSGALTAGALAGAAAAGAAPGALHPLYPLVRGRPADFRGAFFALEAEDERLRAVLEGIVAAAGGRCGTVPAERRALYHAAVTLVSNATVTVTALAAQCLQEAVGVPGALEAILPLLRGAVANLAHSGGAARAIGAAITGPIGRGDVHVLAAHVRAVGEERPELVPLFAAVERATLELAAASGRLSVEAADELSHHLERVDEAGRSDGRDRPATTTAGPATVPDPAAAPGRTAVPGPAETPGPAPTAPGPAATPAMSDFVRYAAHRRALAIHRQRAARDGDCTALAVCGSVARGDARPGSDLDLIVLLREGARARPFGAEQTAGVWVETKSMTPTSARALMDHKPMELYTFLDGRAVADPDGAFAGLQAEARQRYDGCVRADREAVRAWMAAVHRKLEAAGAAGDGFAAGFVAGTSTWPIIDAIWAVNGRPTPPSGAVWAHFADLGEPPPRAWLDDLALGDAPARIGAADRLAVWVLQRLEPLG